MTSRELQRILGRRFRDTGRPIRQIAIRVVDYFELFEELADPTRFVARAPGAPRDIRYMYAGGIVDVLPRTCDGILLSFDEALREYCRIQNIGGEGINELRFGSYRYPVQM